MQGPYTLAALRSRLAAFFPGCNTGIGATGLMAEAGFLVGTGERVGRFEGMLPMLSLREWKTQVIWDVPYQPHSKVSARRADIWPAENASCTSGVARLRIREILLRIPGARLP